MGSRDGQTAANFLPDRMTLPALRDSVQTCQGCDLYKNATQAVFGEGGKTAELMLVGEVPGDREDREGHPFVGPAGRLLDKAIAEAGLDRKQVYITNAVKHFKWEPRGTRRLHKKPTAREIAACQPWLEAEIRVVQPVGIVCLGATAAQSLVGKDFRITRQRGEILHTSWAPFLLATYHPSAVLRAPDEEARQAMVELLIEDLRTAARELEATRARSK